MTQIVYQGGDFPEAAVALKRLMAGLPFPERLDPVELQALGGLYFHNAEGFVLEVARALGERGDLYPDSPVRGADLQERQDRAGAWLRIVCALQHLLAGAKDAYWKEQGEAIGLAKQVCEQAKVVPVGEGGRRDFAQAVARQLGLFGALAILDERWGGRSALDEGEEGQAASPRVQVREERGLRRWLDEGIRSEAARLAGGMGTVLTK